MRRHSAADMMICSVVTVTARPISTNGAACGEEPEGRSDASLARFHQSPLVPHVTKTKLVHI
eukprot:6184425-Pleurochrysis_carterae.AAC.2